MLTKIKFHLKDRGWKNEHFATNLMKIDGEVSEIWPIVYLEMSVYGGRHL